MSSLVPLQLLTRQPLLGTAVKLIVSPALYCPEGQALEFSGEAVGSAPEPLCAVSEGVTGFRYSLIVGGDNKMFGGHGHAVVV